VAKTPEGADVERALAREIAPVLVN
jgi:hypothetical protein